MEQAHEASHQCPVLPSGASISPAPHFLVQSTTVHPSVEGSPFSILIKRAPALMTLFTARGFILLQSEQSAHYFGSTAAQTKLLPLAAPTSSPDPASPLFELFKLAPGQLQELTGSLQAHGIWNGELNLPIMFTFVGIYRYCF